MVVFVGWETNYILTFVCCISVKHIDSNTSTEPVHTFTRALMDTEAEEEGTITLQCETTQSPTKVTWYKGSKEVRSGAHYVMSQKKGILTLTIRQLEETDSETYTCDVGTAKSTAKVTVKGRNDHKVLLSLVGGCRSVYSLHKTLHTALTRLRVVFRCWHSSFPIA